VHLLWRIEPFKTTILKPQKNLGGKAMVTFYSRGTSTEPPTNIVHLGTPSNASVLSVNSKNSTWIIDTGASNHMTMDYGQLKFFKPSPQSVIFRANGSTSPITGEGSVTLSDSLMLDIILVLPYLDYNLLSISQSTSTLTYTVTFWPFLCFSGHSNSEDSWLRC
jgi:hypothetical protein